MEALDRLEREIELRRKSKLLRMMFFNQLSEQQDPFYKYSDSEFKDRFRLTKDCVLHRVYPIVQHKLECSFGSQLSPMLQLLVALRFYGCGAFQKVISDSAEISQSSVHRIIKNVAIAIAEEKNRFITFPSTEQAIRTRLDFMNIAQFPGVTGVIDCTHVVISSPGGENPEIFRNRKGKFTINVQLVCDQNMKFTNIVARWPGSTHDSRIYLASKLRMDLELGRSPSYLIGDGGYGVSAHLLPPVPNPLTAQERRYNRALRSTRSIIERSYGIWKKKFASLGSILRTKLETSLVVIVACAVLHNIAIDYKQYDTDGSETLNETDEDLIAIQDDPNVNMNGQAFRNRIIAEFF